MKKKCYILVFRIQKIYDDFFYDSTGKYRFFMMKIWTLRAQSALNCSTDCSFIVCCFLIFYSTSLQAPLFMGI